MCVCVSLVLSMQGIARRKKELTRNERTDCTCCTGISHRWWICDVNVLFPRHLHALNRLLLIQTYIQPEMTMWKHYHLLRYVG